MSSNIYTMMDVMAAGNGLGGERETDSFVRRGGAWAVLKYRVATQIRRMLFPWAFCNDVHSFSGTGMKMMFNYTSWEEFTDQNNRTVTVPRPEVQQARSKQSQSQRCGTKQVATATAQNLYSSMPNISPPAEPGDYIPKDFPAGSLPVLRI